MSIYSISILYTLQLLRGSECFQFVMPVSIISAAVYIYIYMAIRSDIKTFKYISSNYALFPSRAVLFRFRKQNRPFNIPVIITENSSADLCKKSLYDFSLAIFESVTVSLRSSSPLKLKKNPFLDE